jgi:uncharacterized protein YqjF (DUF2071 family)
MIHFLKNHPFAVEAFFERSLVLTFAVPKAQLLPFIPECLELDTHNNTWAFVAVAMVQTKHLRPKGFPKALGHDFFLIGYRIFVRFTNQAGRRLRGLYILKSETDRLKMTLLGNIFTHYNYSTTDIAQTAEACTERIYSRKSDFEVVIAREGGEVALPQQSPFATWKEARRFAGPLPYTFSYNQLKKEVLIIEGVREHWEPKPVQVSHCHIAWLKTLGLHDYVLANAFEIENIPYYWRKGKIEKWNGHLSKGS